MKNENNKDDTDLKKNSNNDKLSQNFASINSNIDP